MACADSSGLYWVAGFLEGEGCFRPPPKSACISASQVQLEPLLKLQSICGGSVYLMKRKKSQLNHQPAWRWNVNGRPAAEWAMTLYSLMS